jgi:hypothetical protein
MRLGRSKRLGGRSKAQTLFAVDNRSSLLIPNALTMRLNLWIIFIDEADPPIAL